MEYRHDRDAGAGAGTLATRCKAIRTGDHPTVWREMKRQQDNISALQALFTDVPEALQW